MKEPRKLLAELKERLRLLKREHHVNDEDCWYSCPSTDECCNTEAELVCDCGAQEHNEVLLECIDVIAKLEKSL